MAELHDLLTYRQTSSILGISESYCRKLVYEGELPTVQLGKLVKFHPLDVAALVERSRKRATGEAPEQADPVATAVIQFIRSQGGDWTGTIRELLEKTTPDCPPKDFPCSPRGLAARLKRISHLLRKSGLKATKSELRNRRGALYSITGLEVK